MSLALINNGTVLAWGDNGLGQTDVPASITRAVAIATSGKHCLALSADGTVIKWGSAPNVLATSVVGIAAAANGSLALNASGTVSGWGGPAVFVGFRR